MHVKLEYATSLSTCQCTVLYSCCEGCPSCIWRCSSKGVAQIFFSKLYIFWSCYDCYCLDWNFWSPGSSDIQMMFQRSAYPTIQALSLPHSPSQGMGEIGNNKTSTEEIQVTLLGGLWNFESYQAMRFYWLLGNHICRWEYHKNQKGLSKHVHRSRGWLLQVVLVD